MDKVSKRAVNYREATGKDRCGVCSMYRPDPPHVSKCTLVMGEIDPAMTCDEFEPKRA